MAGATVLVIVPAATAAVATDVAVPGEKPVLVAVTRTRIALPRSPGGTVYVFPVAPLMSAPSAIHWYANSSSLAGRDHVPLPAVSDCPTTACPLIVGSVLLVIGGSTLTTSAVAAEVATPSVKSGLD